MFSGRRWRSPWLYNPKADPACTCLETLRPERCIIREERPIDLPVMFLIVDKIHAVKGWDTFLDVFGSPSIFLELPPSTSEEKALEFDRRVQQIVSDGRGTIPNGAKFQTVETTADNSGSFETRAKWCREAIITIATGGLLTVETQAGSGTLAGNAHAESFNELCAGSAASIAQVVNMQWCRPRLASRFPGAPVLARFDFSPEKEDDLAAQAQLIATLSSAGFRPSPETVSEMMGFEVEAVESTQPANPFTPGFQPITNSSASPSEPNSQIVHRTSYIENSSVEPPLTEHELAALQSLSKGFAPAQLEQDADTIYSALAEAVTNSDSDQTGDDEEENEFQPDERGFYDVTAFLKEEDDEEDVQEVENTAKNYGCRAKDPSKCRYHGGFWHPATQSALNNQPGGTNAKALGLPEMSKMKGDKVTPLMSAADARKYMNSGNCKVRSVDGDWVEFDRETCRHIEQDHQFGSRTTKGLTEGEDRLQKLADAMRTVVRPHEVWEELDAAGNSKAKLYLRVYEIGPNKKKVTLGVRWEKESHRIHTYYDINKPKTVEKKRAGKLLYKRDN